MSMKDASKAIGVSAPTISEHIKNLEEHLDVQLFRRKTRSIELTNEGRSIFNHAEEMFSSGIRFLDAVSPKSIGGYPARIGIVETISVYTPTKFILKYLGKFQKFGTVNTIRETNHERMENKILNNELDWGISLYPPRLSDLNHHLVGHSEVMFCASNDAYKKFNHKADLLKHLPLVKSSWDHKLNEMVQNHLELHGIFVEEYFESDHRHFCITLVQKGLCISNFSKDEIQFSSWGKNLKAFSIGSPIYLPFYAIWPKANKKSMSIKKLIECLPKKQNPKTIQRK